MRMISGRWGKTADIGERLDFIGDPEDVLESVKDDRDKHDPKAFIDFNGVNLEHYFDKRELDALKEGVKSMNTSGEETAVLARRAFWLFIRFVPLLIIFLLLMGHEFECGNGTIFRF